MLIPLATEIKGGGDDDIGEGTRRVGQHIPDHVVGLVAHPIVDDRLSLLAVTRKVDADHLAPVHLLADRAELLAHRVPILT